MKKALAMVVFAGLALVLTGCGGGADTTTTPTTTTPATTAATGTTDTSGLREIPTPSTLEIRPVEKYDDKYPDEFAVNIGFKPNADTPQFFTDALKKKLPLLVHFYGESDQISDSMKQSLTELTGKYSGKVLFVLLDSDNPQSYGALSAQLPVQYVPQTFVFNGDSTIIRSYTGYVDKDRLDQALYDAVNRGY